MLETETVLDRRRLRRSVTLWRAAGLAAIAIAIGVMMLGTDKLATLAGEKQIARITIEGTITGEPRSAQDAERHRRRQQRLRRPSLY